MDDKKSIISDGAKEVIGELYSDALKPTMQAVGSIVALPFQAVDAALSVPRQWVLEKQYNFERTKKFWQRN